MDGAQRSPYFAALLTTALAVVFFLGEAAYHRLRGKPYDKGRLVKTATRQTVTALLLLAVALSSVVFLVADLLFGTVASVPLAFGLVLVVGVTWFGLPLRRRLRGDE